MESRAKRQLNYLWAIKTTDIIQLSSTSYSHRTPSAFQHFATTNRNPLNEYVNNNINSIPRFLFFIKSSVTMKGCNVRPFRLPGERHSTPISCWSFSAFSRRFADKILVRKLTFVARHQINAKKQRHLHIFGIKYHEITLILGKFQQIFTCQRAASINAEILIKIKGFVSFSGVDLLQTNTKKGKYWSDLT